jgi:predicted enzyme related to lactoylglutathione lyase
MAVRKSARRKPSPRAANRRRALPGRAAKKTAAKKAPSRKASPKKRGGRAASVARRQPESLRLRSAGPSFTVNDLQASLAFYRDALGFTVGERWQKDGMLLGVELVAGSIRFWIGQDDWMKGRDRVKGQGFRVYCGTLQDLDAIAARVHAFGGSLTEGPKDQEWGRELTVTDPDGFVITISSGL